MLGETNLSGLLFVYGAMLFGAGMICTLITGETWQFAPIVGALFTALLAAKALSGAKRR
jgi:hypothetical protein